MKSNYYLGLASAILLGFVSSVGASGPTVVPLGTAAPPSTLGGFSMTPVGADPSPLDSMVTSVGPITFNQEVRHDQVDGSLWGTWSHGYAGNVYDTGSSVDPTSLTMTMGGEVSAVYFYTEPVNFDDFTFTATTADGTFLTQTVNGNGGASGFGFYATGSDYITSVTVKGTDAAGFAIGEFGLNRTSSVPEAGNTLVYAFLGLLGLFGWQACFPGRQDEATVSN